MPWWLAYIEELDNAAGRLDETPGRPGRAPRTCPSSLGLLDPNEFDETMDRIQEIDAAALAEMNQTTK